MDRELIIPGPGNELGPVISKAEEYIRESKAANTRIAYQEDWQRFCAWCAAHKVESLPATPESIAVYIADMAEKMKPSTIQRHLASISVAHQAKGFTSPTHSVIVRTTLQGIRRVKGMVKDKKSPVRVTHLIHLGDVLPKNLQGIRDKAIFLIGYAGAFRRSELVGLNVEDIRFENEGVRLTLRRSKTDQEANGRVIDINYAAHSVNCPVKALAHWIEKGSIDAGPLFRPINRHGQVLSEQLTPQSVAIVVKRVMTSLGMDSEQFSGHSLRAGFVTDCIKSGIQSQAIRRVTGHRSESTLSEYYRESSTFDYNITVKLGL